MLKLLVLGCLIAMAFGQNEFNDFSVCGKRPAVGDTFVTGGTIAPQGAWPWLVSFEWNGSHFCGGSLINDQWVLTAAHCIDGYTSPTYYPNHTFRLGLDKRNSANSWTVKANVNYMVMHPSYNSRTYENDLALVRLSSKVTFNNYIRPVCLKTSATSIVGEFGWSQGWGTLSSGASTLPNDVYQVSLKFTTDAQCTSYYSNNYKSASMICAGEVGDGKDTCQGDSGGPLVRKDAAGFWEIAGIVSWGYGCGDIGVYSRVSSYENWIRTTIRNNP